MAGDHEAEIEAISLLQNLLRELKDKTTLTAIQTLLHRIPLEAVDAQSYHCPGRSSRIIEDKQISIKEFRRGPLPRLRTSAVAKLM